MHEAVAFKGLGCAGRFSSIDEHGPTLHHSSRVWGLIGLSDFQRFFYILGPCYDECLCQMGMKTNNPYQKNRQTRAMVRLQTTLRPVLVSQIVYKCHQHLIL